MKTKKFDDLYELTKNFQLPAILEGHIYKVAGRLSSSDNNPYDGGYWESEALGDGWFFNLASEEPERSWYVVNPDNYSEVNIGSTGFSLAVFLIALSEFSIYLYQKGQMGTLSDEIAELHRNAMSQAEAILSNDDQAAFFRIID